MLQFHQLNVIILHIQVLKRGRLLLDILVVFAQALKRLLVNLVLIQGRILLVVLQSLLKLLYELLEIALDPESLINRKSAGGVNVFICVDQVYVLLVEFLLHKIVELLRGSHLNRCDIRRAVLLLVDKLEQILILDSVKVHHDAVLLCREEIDVFINEVDEVPLVVVLAGDFLVAFVALLLFFGGLPLTHFLRYLLELIRLVL